MRGVKNKDCSYILIKNTLDLLCAILLFPTLVLTLIIVGPAIYLTSGGPIIYRSLRRGMNGQTFVMYKFRTMINNAPDIRKPDYSTVNGVEDPRVTKIGGILRKTSIDELPQLINVLKGNMSIIGPRPDMSTRSYKDLGDLEKKRLVVKPGITGFTQAYYRNSIPASEKYIKDCYYVDNMSVYLDFKILVRTLLAVVSAKNIVS
ncbi:sugar transferase [Corynebacterium sp. 3HC-13]|uniref:sugar transferase n=1 Tax=Corynebacterium poyangense TaxID=2684405 RepID=UPI001CC97A70|nr:sugar transferase [Corynebacterium poyangense]MBZ8177034.1 sugar transferase [Corynebacterium poyangense]